MRLRTFTAATMREAMTQVREILGEDAVILSTHDSARGQGVRVTAGVDDSRVTREPATAPPSSCLAETLGPYLDYHGVPGELSVRLIRTADRLGKTESTDALAGALERRIAFEAPEPEAERPLVLVGPSGAGKTSTAAKLAARRVLAGETARLLTTDTLRAGAVAQLAAFAGILEQPIATAKTPKMFRQILAEGASGPPTIVDTPGTNPFESRELDDLAGFLNAAPTRPVLVLAAGTDALEAAETARIFARLGCRHLVVTRIDAARRLGALLSAADAGDLALAEVGITPSIPRGLRRPDAAALARVFCHDPCAEDRIAPLESLET